MGSMPSLPWILILLAAGYLVVPQIVSLLIGVTGSLGNRGA